ncbi:MAG: LysR family transcriptional regulator [Actinobacteria bacterium]|nr:LysR family transcriptional regulator [Actinomycetota bacterium]
MNTDSLRQLIALAETGSFSEAASKLGVTQPAISLTVKKIEADLDVRLFQRRGNRYIPSDMGRVFLDHARKVVEAEDRMMADLARAKGGSIGKLHIASSNIPGEYVLPLLLGDLRKEHPGIEPVVEIMDSSKVVAAMLAGVYELGFIGSEPKRGDLELVPFCPDELRVICHPRHPLAGKRSVRPAKLKEERFVLREEGSGTRDIMLKALADAGLDIRSLRVEMELGSTSSVISAVESGLGISLVSAWATAAPLSEGRVSTINVSGLRAKRDFKMVWRKDHVLTSPARTFTEFIKDKRDFLKKYGRSVEAGAHQKSQGA